MTGVYDPRDRVCFLAGGLKRQFIDPATIMGKNEKNTTTVVTIKIYTIYIHLLYIYIFLLYLLSAIYLYIFLYIYIHCLFLYASNLLFIYVFINYLFFVNLVGNFTISIIYYTFTYYLVQYL